jgi:surfactin synthase thioesterase subunit
VVDIVALHGLNGHWNDTWTSSGGVNWLRDEGFLPSQIPYARIMSYGYKSSVFGTKTLARIDNFADGLLAQLQGRRMDVEEQKRPIIFICHSLGGIVAKRVRPVLNAYDLKINSLLFALCVCKLTCGA